MLHLITCDILAAQKKAVSLVTPIKHLPPRAMSEASLPATQIPALLTRTLKQLSADDSSLWRRFWLGLNHWACFKAL